MTDKNGKEVKIGSKIKIKLAMQDAYDTGKVVGYDEEDDLYWYESRGKARWSNGKPYWAVYKGDQYWFGDGDDFEVLEKYGK